MKKLDRFLRSVQLDKDWGLGLGDFCHDMGKLVEPGRKLNDDFQSQSPMVGSVPNEEKEPLQQMRFGQVQFPKEER